MATALLIIMAVMLFLAGFAMVVSGMIIIMTREYQETLRMLSQQSTRLSGKAITDVGVQATLEGTAQLLDAVTRLVATAVGTGAFLCLLGTGICAAGYFMLRGVTG